MAAKWTVVVKIWLALAAIAAEMLMLVWMVGGRGVDLLLSGVLLGR
jgi:hypothetical protein